MASGTESNDCNHDYIPLFDYMSFWSKRTCTRDIIIAVGGHKAQKCSAFIALLCDREIL